ncbi:MAG TPA: hypothetical protein VIM51_05445 [Desulfosporosinus sp.]
MDERERRKRLVEVFALLMKRAEGKMPDKEIKLEIIYNDSIAITEQSELDMPTS